MEKTGWAGTGFLLIKKIQKYVINFELHNERLCKLKGKYNNITLMNAYAPTEGKTEEIMEQFYDNLQYTVDRVPKSDLIIILADVMQNWGKNQHTTK